MARAGATRSTRGAVAGALLCLAVASCGQRQPAALSGTPPATYSTLEELAAAAGCAHLQATSAGHGTCELPVAHGTLHVQLNVQAVGQATSFSYFGTAGASGDNWQISGFEQYADARDLATRLHASTFPDRP